MTTGALPTFVVIGRAKCGTTSLYRYLAEHPEIQMSPTKELRFFCADPDPTVFTEPLPPRLREMISRSGRWERGLDWYRAHFDPAFAVRGEASPLYTSPNHPRAAERMAAVVPDARVILCVRDPVQRALSSYRYRRVRGTEPRPLAEALGRGSYYAEGSRFGALTAPYLERFPRERILVVEAERLDHHRAETMREIFSFLGVDEQFTSPVFDRRWNVTSAQEGGLWRPLVALRRLPHWGFVADNVPRRVRNRIEVATARASAPAAPPLPHYEVPGETIELLREDAARFRELMGLELPNWSV